MHLLDFYLNSSSCKPKTYGILRCFLSLKHRNVLVFVHLLMLLFSFGIPAFPSVCLFKSQKPFSSQFLAPFLHRVFLTTHFFDSFTFVFASQVHFILILLFYLCGLQPQNCWGQLGKIKVIQCQCILHTNFFFFCIEFNMI